MELSSEDFQLLVKSLVFGTVFFLVVIVAIIFAFKRLERIDKKKLKEEGQESREENR